MKSSAHKGAYIILPIGTKSLILARGLVLSEYVNQSHTCNFSSLNFFFFTLQVPRPDDQHSGIYIGSSLHYCIEPIDLKNLSRLLS